MQEIFIRVLGFVVPLFCQSVLRRKALALVNGVVELGVGVGHFPAVDVEFEPLDLGWIVRLFLGQRRNFNGVVHNERRLDHLVFTELVKEHGDNVALLVAVLVLNALLVGQFPGLFVRGDLVEVNAGLGLDGVVHGDPGKRFAEVNVNAVVRNERGTADRLRQMAVHALGQFHHALVVRVRLVEFHQSELGVVTGVDAFVAEDAANFIDPLQAADDETL